MSRKAVANANHNPREVDQFCCLATCALKTRRPSTCETIEAYLTIMLAAPATAPSCRAVTQQNAN